jgi:hypothetical protein
MEKGIATRLSEKIANVVAIDMHHRAMALINAGPKIRSAEYLETKLRASGIEAHAVGDVSLHNAPSISVHVVASGPEAEVMDALFAHDIFFNRVKVRGQEVIHFDCSVGSYTVVLLLHPTEPVRVREVV